MRIVAVVMLASLALASCDGTPADVLVPGGRAITRSVAHHRISQPVRDFDGDGFADLVVGAPGVDRRSGRVFVYRGTSAGWPAHPDLVLGEGRPVGSRFGASIATANVNADGFDDLIVGSEHEACAYVYLGRASGLPAIQDARLEDPLSGATFGHVVASAGDLDGDGYDDVAIAADGASGRVDVFFGGPGGPKSARVTIESEVESSSSFGSAIAGVGDVDGDGFDDLAIGQPYLSDANGYGRAWIVYGGARASIGTRRDTLSNPDSSVFDFGYAIASAGDIDRDGLGDVAIGTWATPGRVYVFRGALGGIDRTPWRTLDGDDATGLHFGQALAGGFDLDGDGFDDLVVGASASDDRSAGRVYLFMGAGGTLSSEARKVRSGDAGEGFGWSVRVDMDAWGEPVVWVGAPFAEMSTGAVRSFERALQVDDGAWEGAAGFGEFGRAL